MLPMEAPLLASTLGLGAKCDRGLRERMHSPLATQLDSPLARALRWGYALTNPSAARLRTAERGARRGTVDIQESRDGCLIKALPRPQFAAEDGIAHLIRHVLFSGLGHA